MAYRERYETDAKGKLKKVVEEVEMPQAVADWMEESGFEQVLEDAAASWVKHSIILPEYVRNLAGEVLSIEIKEPKYMRAAKADDKGKVKRWYWSNGWAEKSTAKKYKIEGIDVYQGETAQQARFVMPLGDMLFNDGYYPIPSWWGSWEWIELANEIPAFHKANLMNGYNIRWHIQIPHDYFLDYEKMNAALTEEEKSAVLAEAKKQEQNFIDDINDVLAGLNNSGRTVISKYEIDKAMGKEYPGIKITPLNYDMKDGALLELFEKSNTANISSQGMHPTIANIETAGKLSSGTEIRNAFLMWLIINTPIPRRAFMRMLKPVADSRGWDKSIKYGIRDYELTALSTDKSGMQEKPAPTE
jgi:hypothetical protein